VLVLGRSRDLLFHGEMGEEGGDFLFTHLVRMPLLMEEDKSPNPIEVSLFGADAVVLDAEMPADAIEQAGARDERRWGSDHGWDEKGGFAE
jgi:hypothetical protein